MNRIIRTTRLRKSSLALALGMCFAGGVCAQSNSTGSIAGTTQAGATVTIENSANGFKREITADSSGSYRIGSLPTGTYKVTTNGQTRDVNVTIGGTAQATNIGAVTVSGNGVINAIDVSSVESTTILTAEQIAKIPVGRNITAVALLAPGTVRGDAAFGNLASFGGSSVAENAYFVNGFNITNAFKNLNFGQVPFEAIAEQQIKTGGYGAEFGRSTGGVINLVTKRGTNEFHAGGNIFITPDSLREKNPNVYTNGGYVGVFNQVRPSILYADNSKDSAGSNTTATVWASGALVKDHLFAYAL
ncbi:MAG TPA: TonB-dependent receptor, partial [Arenimonas sp.]|uniref:TonB-dependent receptor n=1 Tax=Arenimonas sp. TaxID=1872635 RepID=UPI002CC912D4